MLQKLLQNFRPAPVFDEAVASCMMGLAVMPGMLEDLPKTMQRHPLVLGASLLDQPAVRLGADQRESVEAWFQENSHYLRLAARGVFFTKNPDPVLESARALLPAITRRLSIEVPSLLDNPNLAIASSLQDPLIILEFSPRVQKDPRVLSRILEAASYHSDGLLPNAIALGSFRLWNALPVAVRSTPESMEVFRGQLQKELVLSGPHLEALQSQGKPVPELDLSELPNVAGAISQDYAMRDMLQNSGIRVAPL